jgi:hypothetical protein
MGVVGNIVGGLIGSKSSKAPAAPQAPTPHELSEYKSLLDDPALSLYAQQTFGDLGYNASQVNGTKDVIEQIPASWVNTRTGKTSSSAPRSSFGRSSRDWVYTPARSVVKSVQQPGAWSVTKGAEPTAYGNIRTNYGNEYKRASDQLFNDMASRGILRSGATGDAANKMAQATATSIANAIEGSRQSSLDRLGALLSSERAQQANATNAANSNQQNAFQNANTAYQNQMAARQNNINELSTILGGIGGLFGGGKKTSGYSGSMGSGGMQGMSMNDFA